METNKVIGIHKEGSINFEFNKGTYLKNILIDFIQKNTNKIKENKDNISYNNANIQNNYENDNNINLINFNIEENNNFNQLNSIKFEDEIYDDGNKPGQKFSVIFKNQFAKKTVLLLIPNRTIDEMLTAYLKKIKKPEFIGRKHDPYSPRFIYNNNTLSFGDKTKILKLFKWSLHPTIFVFCQNNLISLPQSQNNKSSKIKDCKNDKNIICKLIKYILILTILILMYFLYFLSLEECNEEFRYYIEYRFVEKRIKNEIFSCIIIELMMQLIIQLINHKYISKLHIIHIILVSGYYYYRGHELNFPFAHLFYLF